MLWQLLLCRHEPVLGPAVDEIDKDNATLVDANQRNQGLTSDDIAAMAASGKVSRGQGRQHCYGKAALLWQGSTTK
jgi:hypothetical protein